MEQNHGGNNQPRYSRILLKLSGEALSGNKDMGIDAQVLDQMSLSIAHLVGLGVQVGIVVVAVTYIVVASYKRRFGWPCNR